MPKPLCLFFLLFFPGLLSAQEMQFTLSLLDRQLQPMVGVEVKLVETYTRASLQARTNAQGQATFQIQGGKIWQMNILEIQNYYKWQLVMPEEGTAFRQKTITYDPELFTWEMRPPVDRSKLSIEEIRQNHDASLRPTAQESVVQLVVRDKNARPLAQYPLRLTSIELKKSYIASTDAQGNAFFRVPSAMRYELDVEEVEGYKLVSVPRGPVRMRQTLTFEPYRLPEEVSGNNIIRQKIPANLEFGTSARMLFTGRFESPSGSPLANQKIQLVQMDSQVIYEAESDEYGEARFMLPIGKNYGVHEGDLEGIPIVRKVLDLSRSLYEISFVRARVVIHPRPQWRQPDAWKVSLPQDSKALAPYLETQGFKLLDFQNLSAPSSGINYVVFEDSKALLGLSSGFLLTTGSAWNAFGPNNTDWKSRANAYYELSDRVPKALHYQEEGIYDACILELKVEPQGHRLFFEYVFASEEYSEYNDYDDAFGIFIEGPGFDPEKNQALSPDQSHRISVTQINDSTHSDLFQANRDSSQSRFQDWQYDGFTKKMGTRLEVVPGQIYRIRMIILDRRDAIYDSGVFVRVRSE